LQARTLRICNWRSNIEQLLFIATQQGVTAKEISMYNKTTLVAVSTAVAVGFLGLASAALANDVDVNASGAQAAREMQGNPLPWWWNSQDRAAGSYTYQPIQPSHQKVSKPKK
jgi:hypothetical protein